MFAELEPFSVTDHVVRLTVKVTPNAARNRLGDIISADGVNMLKVYLTAPPVDGKANKALIEYLSEILAIPKSCFSILQGQHDRYKILELSGDPTERVQQLRGLFGR